MERCGKGSGSWLEKGKQTEERDEMEGEVWLWLVGVTYNSHSEAVRPEIKEEEGVNNDCEREREG